MEKMKNKILKDLDKIKKVAKSTSMEGKIVIEYTGLTLSDWEKVIESIDGYKRYNNFVDVTPKLTVILMLILKKRY